MGGQFQPWLNGDLTPPPNERKELPMELKLTTERAFELTKAALEGGAINLLGPHPGHPESNSERDAQYLLLLIKHLSTLDPATGK